MSQAAFSFGKNWAGFAERYLSEERLRISQKYLIDFLGLETLEGKSFLDIGCGSGIHSWGAFESKAAHVTSFDVDPFSVQTTQKVRSFKGDPETWCVFQASILDDSLISKVEPADIVYSWGVLHHTGDLWKAMRNAARFLKEGGLFYIAIYDKTSQSDYWKNVKQKYNRASALGKKWMEFIFVIRLFVGERPFYSFFKKLKKLGKLKQTAEHVVHYKRERGMEFWTDVRDWLGGWPYEPATAQEVILFCEKELGLKKLKVRTGEANIEYLFKKKTGFLPGQE